MDPRDMNYVLKFRPAERTRSQARRRLLKQAAEYRQQQEGRRPSLLSMATARLTQLLNSIKAVRQHEPPVSGHPRPSEITGEPG